MAESRTWTGVSCPPLGLARVTKLIIPTWDPAVSVGDGVELAYHDGRTFTGEIVNIEVTDIQTLVSIKLTPPALAA